MSNSLKSLVLGAVAGVVAAAAPAEARHYYSPPGPIVINPARDTGGYCDSYGCPDHCWTYPIFYGPVFVHGIWYRGPVYVRDDRWGHHWFWVHGDWRRDEWRGPRPYWARNPHFGPAMDFSYYQSHGFNVGGRWRQEHQAWMWNHREAWNRGAPGNYQSGNYPGSGPNQGGYQGAPSGPTDEWNRDRYDERHSANGENWRQGPPPDRYAANPQQNGGYDRGYRDQNNWNGNQGGPSNQGGSNASTPNGSNSGASNGSNSPDANAKTTASTGPHPNLIIVKSATYGASCNQSKGNVTKFLQEACNGHDRCDYSVRYQAMGGDPAPGCSKDFSVEWVCSDGSGGSASAPAEAGFGSKVSLQCAGSHG